MKRVGFDENFSKSKSNLERLQCNYAMNEWKERVVLKSFVCKITFYSVSKDKILEVLNHVSVIQPWNLEWRMDLALQHSCGMISLVWFFSKSHLRLSTGDCERQLGRMECDGAVRCWLVVSSLGRPPSCKMSSP